MILNFRFQPHGTGALTTPSGSPLHRGRDGREKTFQCNNAAILPLPKGELEGVHSKLKIYTMQYPQLSRYPKFHTPVPDAC